MSETNPLHINNYSILTNGDMSQNSLYSQQVNLDELVTCSLQAVWTGSPVGTLTIGGSDDISGTGQFSSVASVAVSGSGDLLVNFDAPGFSLLNVLYTKTSGTGTLNIRFNGKI